MAKNSESKSWRRTNITQDALRKYAAALHEIAKTHEKIAELMRESKIPSVDARGLTQAITAHTRISSFLGSVVDAYCDNVLAKGVGQLHDAVHEIAKQTARLPKDESPAQFPAHNPAADEAIEKTNAKLKKKNP